MKKSKLSRGKMRKDDPNTKMFNLRLSPFILEVTKRVARKEGVATRTFIRNCLLEAIKEKEGLAI